MENENPNSSKTSLEELNEPEENNAATMHIEWTPEFCMLNTTITPEVANVQKGQYNMAIDILARTLYMMYGETSYSRLYKECETAQCSEKFSNTLEELIELSGLSKNTKASLLCSLKKILKSTAITSSFVDKISVKSSRKRLDPMSYRNALPKKYKYLEENNPTFQLLILWIKHLKCKTKLKRPMSIGQLLYFVMPILEKNGYDVENWSESDYDRLKNNLAIFQPFIKDKRTLNFVKNFAKGILEMDLPFSMNIYTDDRDIIIREDSDIHRISADELDLIYEASTNDKRSELIILLLSTTGMRIGGLANIKMNNVCKIVNGKYEINDIGKTIEKGNKWFAFNINAKVKEVLWDWLTNYRKASPDCDYLFVGIGGPLSTNRIRNIINGVVKDAGLEGDHLHPHAFRHSFAHILLECGNSVDCIAKMMGHNSSKTTETYYLKESAAEVGKRINVPWLNSENKKGKVVPDFLSTTETNTEKAKRKEKQNRKRETNAELKNLRKSLVTTQAPITPPVPTFET